MEDVGVAVGGGVGSVSEYQFTKALSATSQYPTSSITKYGENTC